MGMGDGNDKDFVRLVRAAIQPYKLDGQEC